jgi:hypothetical protein
VPELPTCLSASPASRRAPGHSPPVSTGSTRQGAAPFRAQGQRTPRLRPLLLSTEAALSSTCSQALAARPRQEPEEHSARRPLSREGSRAARSPGLALSVNASVQCWRAPRLVVPRKASATTRRHVLLSGRAAGSRCVSDPGYPDRVIVTHPAQKWLGFTYHDL